MLSEHPVRLMLDSGAYSCWRKGEELNVERYGEFILKFKPWIDRAVNLDVIPGEFGRVPSGAEVEKSAEKGYANLLTLRGMGVEAMPVFHQGESLSWLEMMLAEGFDYIGISPANDRTTKQKRRWLDEIFEYLCGNHKYPSIKTHAFGVTALDLVDEYPWFSYDSITWVLIAAYGAILAPALDYAGKPSYVVPPMVVFFSESPRKRPDQLSTTGKHISQLGPAMQKYVMDYVTSLGLDPTKLGGNYVRRQEVNARFFMEVEKAGEVSAYGRKSHGFFSRHSTAHGRDDNWIVKSRKIFTCSTAAEHSRILQEFKQRDRLLSYFYFKDSDPFDLATYVQTGLIPKKKQAQERVQLEA